MNNFVKLKKILLGVILSIVLVLVAFKSWEDVDAGEILVVQSVSGDLTVTFDSGPAWQGFGKATHYRKSSQINFMTVEDAAKIKMDLEKDLSLLIKFNDGGTGHLSGSMRLDLPTNEIQMKKVHSTYGSQEGIESQLVNTNISKAIFTTGPLMTSKESYAERKNDLLFYIEDQSTNGSYKTRQVEVKTKDTLSHDQKTTTRVEILEKSPGVPFRQEKSSILEYGIRLHNLSIVDIHYDPAVRAQIKTQQETTMSVQTSIANAKRAEQDAITTVKQGEADAAKAKWAQEVIKSTLVTKAEANKDVAELAVKTAQLNKQRDILEGEGIAAKKRLIMQADGALDQKLQAYIQTQKFWATAFQNYGGALVPTYVSGGGGSGNAGFNFMEMMSAKAAKDLGLDLSNKRR